MRGKHDLYYLCRQCFYTAYSGVATIMKGVGLSINQTKFFTIVVYINNIFI